MDILVNSTGQLIYGDKKYRCTLGQNGITTNKKEGDQATPAGRFPIRKIFYRPDIFLTPPTTLFLTQPLTQTAGWCDDPTRIEYNTFITLPYSGSHEKLWRTDHLYDLMVVLGYNDNPPIADLGSAIFLCVAKSNYLPTNGCIGLDQQDLLELIKNISLETQICIEK